MWILLLQTEESHGVVLASEGFCFVVGFGVWFFGGFFFFFGVCLRVMLC